jgi:hypothetical protein
MADKGETFNELVSYNSEYVLWALFILVIIILLVFTITVKMYPELSDRLNTIFIAAISGSLALGGTLITQLWGRKSSNEGLITSSGGNVEEPGTDGVKKPRTDGVKEPGTLISSPTNGTLIPSPTNDSKILMF